MNANKQNDGAAACRETYDVYRDYLKHEDNLINNRMTWLILSQSFFFTAFALAIGRLTVVDPLIADQIGLFLKSLAVLGMVVAGATCLSVVAALTAIEGLRQRWKKHSQTNDTNETYTIEKSLLPDLTGGGDPFASTFGFFMPIAMPLIFLFTWCYIFSKI